MADLVAYNNMMELGSASYSQSGLIPSLPDDVFVKCLLRVPVQWHAHLQRVSRSVRDVVQSPEYYEQRKKEGASTSFICMLQSMPMTTETSAEKKSSTLAYPCDPVYGITVLDLQQQLWERLPAVPGLVGGLPTFCKLVALKGMLVVLGGWWQNTWEPSKCVFVYNFSNQTWRKGADMPNVRSFFACGALGSKLYVAGGHDADKKALSSADVFDLETNCWTSLCSMHEERDECTGAVLNGKLYVVSGYKTEAQGVFVKSAEILDTASNVWTRIANMWPLESVESEVGNPGALTAMSGHLCGIHGKNILVYSCEKNIWTVVGKVAEEEKGEISSPSITSTSSSLLITGLARKNGTSTLRTFSLNRAHDSCKSQWQTFAGNDQFSNLVQTSCAFEL